MHFLEGFKGFVRSCQGGGIISRIHFPDIHQNWCLHFCVESKNCIAFLFSWSKFLPGFIIYCFSFERFAFDYGCYFLAFLELCLVWFHHRLFLVIFDYKWIIRCSLDSIGFTISVQNLIQQYSYCVHNSHGILCTLLCTLLYT